MKKRHIGIRLVLFVLIILAIGSIFIFLDWSRYMSGIVIDPAYGDPSRLLKRVASLLCLVTVFTAGANALTRADNRLLSVIFSGIFCGDVLLLFNVNVPGIGLFFLVQILLFVRHISGFGVWIGESGSVAKIISIAIVVAIAELVLHRFLFYPLFAGKEMYPFVIAYSSALGLSLMSALCVPFMGKFPPANGLLIAAGMTFFFMCDCTVGIRMASDDPMTRTLATSLTWVFYTPALVSLTLSGYDLAGVFRRERVNR